MGVWALKGSESWEDLVKDGDSIIDGHPHTIKLH